MVEGVHARYNHCCSRSSKPYAIVFGGVLLPQGKGLKHCTKVALHFSSKNNRLSVYLKVNIATRGLDAFPIEAIFFYVFLIGRYYCIWVFKKYEAAYPLQAEDSRPRAHLVWSIPDVALEPAQIQVRVPVTCQVAYSYQAGVLVTRPMS